MKLLHQIPCYHNQIMIFIYQRLLLLCSMKDRNMVRSHKAVDETFLNRDDTLVAIVFCLVVGSDEATLLHSICRTVLWAPESSQGWEG